jgi:predicted O-methyltransferase YrrM
LASFIAHGEKSDRAYEPSYSFDGELLNEAHATVHEKVSGIDGWLEPEDSLKLYELGYLADGPFLEIGTYRGKSSTVLTTALRDAGRHVAFYSLDIDQEALESARGTLAEKGLGRYVTLIHGSVKALVRAVPAFQPRFVFLDGDHSAAGLARDLATIEAHVPEGGVLLFHDYLDDRNDMPDNKDYGVRQAIGESWVERDCEFAGAFGCSGLFRRLRGPRVQAVGDAPDLIELMAVDRLPVRLRVNVARPGKRFVRRVLTRLPGARRG